MMICNPAERPSPQSVSNRVTIHGSECEIRAACYWAIARIYNWVDTVSNLKAVGSVPVLCLGTGYCTTVGGLDTGEMRIVSIKLHFLLMSSTGTVV